MMQVVRFGIRQILALLADEDLLNDMYWFEIVHSPNFVRSASAWTFKLLETRQG